jgi:hypothetical protein
MNITTGEINRLALIVLLTSVWALLEGCKPGEGITKSNSPPPASGKKEVSSSTKTGKLRACPEEWIINKMPSTDDSTGKGTQYFIYQGKRRELSEFDFEWVQKNCNLTPQVVY